jgi:hypothetical protein
LAAANGRAHGLVAVTATRLVRSAPPPRTVGAAA